MEEIYKSSNGGSVWVGNDEDYLKVKDNPEWVTARMCKYGPGGHQQTLGYTTLAAPKGKNYLSVVRDNRIAVNIIDMEDPNLIPFECITTALDYIKRKLAEGKKVLIACNQGHSRGPSTGLAFLRSVGDMPYNFHKSETIYKTLCPEYDPGQGMRQVLRSHWAELNGVENA